MTLRWSSKARDSYLCHLFVLTLTATRLFSNMLSTESGSKIFTSLSVCFLTNCVSGCFLASVKHWVAHKVVAAWYCYNLFPQEAVLFWHGQDNFNFAVQSTCLMATLRPSSDVVLLPCWSKFRNKAPQKHGRSTRLLPCKTKFTNQQILYNA